MQFVEGDRVFFRGNEYAEADSGVVVAVYRSVYRDEAGSVWVEWDSDGAVQYIDEALIELEGAKSLDEQQAVMLLLSLGYTVSKN